MRRRDATSRGRPPDPRPRGRVPDPTSGGQAPGAMSRGRLPDEMRHGVPPGSPFVGSAPVPVARCAFRVVDADTSATTTTEHNLQQQPRQSRQINDKYLFDFTCDKDFF